MPQQTVQDTIAAHRRREKRRWTIMLLFIVFCLITFILDLTNGAAGGKISAKDVLYALLQFRDTAPEAACTGRPSPTGSRRTGIASSNGSASRASITSPISSSTTCACPSP